MTLHTWTWIFGIVFIILGILGFTATVGGLLFGAFIVGTGLSLVFLAAGILAVIAAFVSPETERLFFQVFGVLFVLAALIGFVGGTTVLGLFGVNMASSFLNLIIGAIALYVGFGLAKRMEREEAVRRTT